MPVRVICGHLSGFFIVEIFDALVCFTVDLDVVEGPVGLGEFVGVARVAVHMTVGIWSATVREKVHDLVSGFLMGGKVVPEHGRILEIGLGVALLGMDEDGELGRISEEKDWGIVENPIPVALLSIKFDGKASWVSSGIRGAFFSTHG